VYALSILFSSYPAPSSATLDAFQIDATNTALASISSQTFTLPGTFLGMVTDPNHHFFSILMSAPSSGSSLALPAKCGISFDLQTGLPVSTTSGLCGNAGTTSSGEDPLGISISSKEYSWERQQKDSTKAVSM